MNRSKSLKADDLECDFVAFFLYLFVFALGLFVVVAIHLCSSSSSHADPSLSCPSSSLPPSADSPYLPAAEEETVGAGPDWAAEASSRLGTSKDPQNAIDGNSEW